MNVVRETIPAIEIETALTDGKASVVKTIGLQNRRVVKFEYHLYEEGIAFNQPTESFYIHEEEMARLIRAAIEMFEALREKWGYQWTPFGQLHYSLGRRYGNESWWVEVDGHHKPICIVERESSSSLYIYRIGGDRYHTPYTISDVHGMISAMAAMAQYFAGKDFKDKLDNSIRMAKRVAKAIGGDK